MTIPSLSISRHDGEEVRDMLTASAGTVQITSADEGPDLWQQNLADFSGKGPTGDGRLMPDIVAPGADIWSAKAAGHCGYGTPPPSVTSMRGTSMAAPVAAGGVALVRQYFEEAWYPGGVKGSGQGHEASGALLRAMIMNGGRRLTGSLDVSGDGGNQWVELDRFLPNNQQGYGAMDLETVLYFNPQSGRSPPALFVRDDMGPFRTDCLNTGDATAFGFLVSSGKRFKATIAWTDPPASLVADVVLVNDLDLTVLGPGNKEWIGNNITSRDKEGGGYVSRDRTNNKEQVELVFPTAGEYTVIVRGHHVPEGPQCYSLVVTGDFVEMSAEVACSASCSLHGTCVAGECVCIGLWSGVDCLRPIPLLSSGIITAIVYPDAWQYFAIEMGPVVGGSFHVTMQKKSLKGDPDLFIRREALPNLVDFTNECECVNGGRPPCECREISCDSCDDSMPPPRQLKSSGQITGRYIIGVTAFCCDAVEFTLNVRLLVMGCDSVLSSGVTQGCDGKCPSTAVQDICGVCKGDNTECQGCDSIPNSGKVIDDCGVCGGDDSSCVGCDGAKNSGLVLDACGDCAGNGTKCLGCDSVANSGLTTDVCDECDGDGTSCLGCDGRPKSGKMLDACGECDGDGSKCKGCDGVHNSGKIVDACGQCGGDSSSCKGCDGKPNSGAVVDGCGVCKGTNSSCMGCDVLLYGAHDDYCGVCGGDNNTCLVCDAGMTGVDKCGVCGGDNASCAWLSSWSAPVRVIAAIQLTGISVEALMVDTASMALSRTIADYLECQPDKVRLRSIIQKSSDARRLHSTARNPHAHARTRMRAYTHIKSSPSSANAATQSRIPTRAATPTASATITHALATTTLSAPSLQAHGDGAVRDALEEYVVFSFHADVAGALCDVYV